VGPLRYLRSAQIGTSSDVCAYLREREFSCQQNTERTPEEAVR